MKCFRSRIALLIALAGMGGAPAFAQNTTSITAASGSLTMNGSAINGTLTIASTGAVHTSGGGLAVVAGSQRGYITVCSVASGGVVGTCAVPNAATANNGAGVCYNLTLRDSFSGLAQPLQNVCSITGSSWALDQYTPSTTAPLPAAYQYTTGGGAPSGSAPALALYYDTTGHVLYVPCNGSWCPASGTGSSTFAGGTITGATTVANTLNVTGSTTFGSTVTLAADPSANLQAATKQYVDARVSSGGTTFTGGSVGNPITAPNFYNTPPATGGSAGYALSASGADTYNWDVWATGNTNGLSGVSGVYDSTLQRFVWNANSLGDIYFGTPISSSDVFHGVGARFGLLHDGTTVGLGSGGGGSTPVGVISAGSSSSSLAAAFASCTTTPAIVQISYGIPVTSSTTLPLSCGTQFFPGGELLPASGVTLTYADGRQITAPTTQKIFGGAGAVVGLKGDIPVEWFGAVSDGTFAGTGTDNTAAFNLATAALAARHGHVLAYGFYNVSGPIITSTGVGVEGGVTDGSLGIIVNTSPTATTIQCGNGTTAAANVELRDLWMGRSVTPSGSARGVSADNCPIFVMDQVVSGDSNYDFYFHNSPGSGVAHISNTTAQWGDTLNAPYPNGAAPVFGYFLDSADGTAENSLNFYNAQATNQAGSAMTSTGFEASGTAVNDLTVDGLLVGTTSIGAVINSTGCATTFSDGDIHLHGLVLDSLTQQGIVINGISQACRGGVILDDFYVEENNGPGGYASPGYGVNITNSSGVILSNGQVEAQNGSVMAEGIHLSGDSDLSINATQFLGTTVGLHLIGSTNIAIGGNIFQGTATSSTGVIADSSSTTRWALNNVITGFPTAVSDASGTINRTCQAGSMTGINWDGSLVCSTTVAAIDEWRFNDGSGTTLANTDNAGETATITAGASWTTASGFTGNILGFSGSGNNVHTASVSDIAFGPTTPFTACVWVRPTAATTGVLLATTTGGGSTAGPGWQLYLNNNGGTLNPVFDIYDSSGVQMRANADSTAIPLNSVSQICATSPGTNQSTGMTLYVNGVAPSPTYYSNTGGLGSVPSSTVLAFGSQTDLANPFVGQMGYARIYNAALTASQISALYAAGVQ